MQNKSLGLRWPRVPWVPPRCPNQNEPDGRWWARKKCTNIWGSIVELLSGQRYQCLISARMLSLVALFPRNFTSRISCNVWTRAEKWPPANRASILHSTVMGPGVAQLGIFDNRYFCTLPLAQFAPRSRQFPESLIKSLNCPPEWP